MENKKHTILLAEDEESVRVYVSEVLEKNGYIVLQAKDGEEAIDLYHKHHKSLDLIISDLVMPNVGGKELAKFNFEHCYIPFIVFTALADARNAIELMNYGVRDYVLKPMLFGRLITTVDIALRRNSLSRYLEEDVNPYSGNVGSIIISSKISEIQRGMNWITSKLKDSSAKESDLCTTAAMVFEIMMNAHEHGNLKISEKEKEQLINDGRYEAEISERENECMARIHIDVSVLKSEVAIRIADDGTGFKYYDYLNVDEDKIANKIENVNGRGIFMASRYFDSFEYSKGGAIVLMTKKYT